MRCTSIQSTHQLILEKAILSNTESEVEQTTIPSSISLCISSNSSSLILSSSF